MSFLRNPLAWYKRYVEGIYDTPSGPSSVIGRAGHMALQRFYEGMEKEQAIKFGFQYLRAVPDFEINFGKAKSKAAKKKKRFQMEKDYEQAVGFYLHKPPRYRVVGVEVKSVANIKGLPLPLKAVSDLVVESSQPGFLDIVDHKFVDSFSPGKASKTLFVIQALFNYYTVRELYKRPIGRFIVNECKKSKNADSSSQMRRYILDYADCEEDFEVFHRLIKDATKEISRPRLYLPNPSDMFEGENSFDIYR
ncbi:MAG: PD-(D/E)XK nuclease family protein, partial [Patescibacteria group bacterium]